jgi:hypothetical protein
MCVDAREMLRGRVFVSGQCLDKANATYRSDTDKRVMCDIFTLTASQELAAI